MKKWISIIVFILLFSGCSSVKWTKYDTYRHSALTTVMAVDYLQTMKIARNPDRWHEENPILGKHPSEAAVSAYFAASYALTTAAALALPDPYREYFQYIVIGVETAVVANNFSVGLGFGF